jgi:nucleoside-diphosphate-sugar epimerase
MCVLVTGGAGFVGSHTVVVPVERPMRHHDASDSFQQSDRHLGRFCPGSRLENVK